MKARKPTPAQIRRLCRLSKSQIHALIDMIRAHVETCPNRRTRPCKSCKRLERIQSKIAAQGVYDA